MLGLRGRVAYPTPKTSCSAGCALHELWVGITAEGGPGGPGADGRPLQPVPRAARGRQILQSLREGEPPASPVQARGCSCIPGVRLCRALSHASALTLVLAGSDSAQN